MRDLNNTSSKLNEGHKKLAQTLISLHQTKNPFRTLPKYNYDQLQKGIYCEACKSFLVSIKNRNVICSRCGEHEKIEQAILRNTKEFKLLFPDRKITSKSIYDWCRLEVNSKTVRRILKKNLTSVGNTRDTYYQ